MPKDWKYLRGDIYYADMEPHIGSEQGGTRPVVVLQNDIGNRYAPTLIVATVTSRTEKKRYQPTHVLIAHNTAFEKPSVVQLEQNLHQQRIAVDRQQLNDFFLLDDEFHQKLSIIADCQLAWETVENIKAAIDRVRYMSLDHVTSPEMLLRQHHEIFTALEKRDAEAVEKAMSIHLHEISESVLLIRQENRDWFSEE